MIKQNRNQNEIKLLTGDCKINYFNSVEELKIVEGINNV